MTARQDIRLINAASVERLPLVLMQRWRQWLVEAHRLHEIKTLASGGGWLDPRHTDELWLPQGLPAPDAELGLQFMIKAGQIRYLMPSLTTALSCRGTTYRNRGLRTLPLAHTWTNFTGLQLARLKLHGFVREDADEPWRRWCEPLPLDPALSAIIPVLAEGPDALKDGFHLVSVPLTQAVTPPNPDWELGLLLADGDDLHELLDEASPPCATLRVTCCATARLSESFSRPEVYADLIDSESVP